MAKQVTPQEEAAAYANSVWNKAIPTVIIMTTIHLVCAMILVGFANQKIDANYFLYGAPVIFNWWVSKAIVKAIAGKRRVRQPYLLGIIASGVWIIFTIGCSIGILVIQYFNNLAH